MVLLIAIFVHRRRHPPSHDLLPARSRHQHSQHHHHWMDIIHHHAFIFHHWMTVKTFCLEHCLVGDLRLSTPQSTLPGSTLKPASPTSFSSSPFIIHLGWHRRLKCMGLENWVIGHLRSWTPTSILLEDLERSWRLLPIRATIIRGVRVSKDLCQASPPQRTGLSLPVKAVFCAMYAANAAINNASVT